MRNKSIKSKVIAGLIMAGIVMSIGNGVSAANMGRENDGMQTQLNTLVTAGTITSDQEAAVITALTPSTPPTDGGQKGARGQGHGKLNAKR